MVSNLKAGHVSLNNIIEGSPYFVKDWSSKLKALGINTIRWNDGGQGSFNLNPLANPNWAVKFDSILETISNAGFLCYAQSMGSPWGEHFGLNDYQLGFREITTSLEGAKRIIDALAGDNSLSKNFLDDPRIALWAVGNESNIADQNALNYLRAVCDYMRSKGAMVAAGAWSFNWDDNLARLVPLLSGHVDWIELHQYGMYQLIKEYNLGNGTFDWEKWKNWLRWYWQNQFDNAGEFADKVFLGEYGIENDYSEFGSAITPQNKLDYFKNLYSITRDYPIQWYSMFCVFQQPAYNYGIVDASNGNWLSGASEVAEFFGGYVPAISIDPHVGETIGGSTGGTGCFIATAANMTPAQLTQLRKIRDLIKQFPDGKALVDFYYAKAQKYVPLVEGNPELQKDIHDALELILKGINKNPLIKKALNL